MASLKTKLSPLVGAGVGAVALASVMLGGHDGLEGRRYVPYLDVGGVLTVCDGHTGSDIVRGRKYSDDECDALLNADLATVARRVDPMIAVQIPDTTRAAFYSFAYNVGTGAFNKSTLLSRLNAGDTVGACDELLRWVYAGGQKWKGLMNRRAIEHEICNWATQPDYPAIAKNAPEALQRDESEKDGNDYGVVLKTLLGLIAAACGGTVFMCVRRKK